MPNIRLKDIDTWTKVFAVVCLSAEAIFLYSLRVLPPAHVLYGQIVCAVVLIAMVAGIVIIQVKGGGRTDERIPDEAKTGPMYVSSEGRREALDGKWIGTLKQKFKGKLIESAIEMDFNAKDDRFDGVAALDHPNGPRHPKLRFNVVGVVFHDPIFRLDYRNKVDSVLQFGSFFARLDATGKSFVGRFVGYGSLVDQIAYGEVSARKAP